MENSWTAKPVPFPSAFASSSDSMMARLEPMLACPVDGSYLAWNNGDRKFVSGSGRQYELLNGIPSIFVPNDWHEGRGDVTDIVKAFYEETPFPNYNDVDDRRTLKQKATISIFAKLLDAQLPNSVKILEAGCGTGQLSNFLGMAPGRTCVGGDICLNSLTLGNDFRDRFSINNTSFIQMNLFRPPFLDNVFDLVISNGVLHHTSDPEAGYRAILRKAKPGGFIIVGLYNYFGRLQTLSRRKLIETFGKGAALLDDRLRRLKWANEQYTAWFRDQYEHPHESRHSIDEVLNWFETSGVDFLSCIPTIGDTEFTDDFQLFETHPTGSYLDRLSTQWDMFLSGGADGALFIMIGRKR
jgi:SAM-dependent methyltransferase